jgi:Ca2+-binding EF-hand superfamily protein
MEFLDGKQRDARLNKRETPMKTIPVCSLLSGMVLPVLCLAQTLGPERPGKDDAKAARREGMRPFVEAWKRADSDQNGRISKAEFDAMPRLQNLAAEKRDKLFTRLDKNADGELRHDELAQMMKPFDGKMGGLPHLMGLDADKSGGISFEEFKQSEFFSKLPAERQGIVFGRLDTDGDGQITPRDRPEPQFRGPDREGHPRRPDKDEPDHMDRVNRKLDLDGDGALSFEEFRAGPSVKNLTEDQQEDRFEVLDRNHDLKISQEDFSPTPPKKSDGKVPEPGR